MITRNNVSIVAVWHTTFILWNNQVQEHQNVEVKQQQVNWKKNINGRRYRTRKQHVLIPLMVFKNKEVFTYNTHHITLHNMATISTKNESGP
jgi:hypothetical protein